MSYDENNSMNNWFEQVPGAKLFRIRSLEYWIKKDPIGKKNEDWLYSNFDSIIRSIAPGTVVEGEFYRLNEKGNGRKYAINLGEGVGRLTDFSEITESGKYLQIDGLIPSLCYIFGNEILRTLSNMASENKDVNFNVCPMIPLDEEDIPKLGNVSGVWNYRDYDGSILFRRFRIENGGEKEFRQLGEMVGHWVRDKASGEMVWTEGGTRKKVRSVRGFPPFYNMHLLVSRRWTGVVVVEGEKACDALNDWFQKTEMKDWLAVTPGPAGMFHSFNTELLKNLVSLFGYTFYFWPDRDSAGLKAVERFIKTNKVLSKNCKYWRNVTSMDRKEGWDAADIESPEEFLEVWEKFQNELVHYLDPTSNQSEINGIRIPEHGLFLIGGRASLYDIRRGIEYSKSTVDAHYSYLVPRDKKGRLVAKPFDYLTQEADEDLRPPVLWDLNGYSSKEPLLYWKEERLGDGTTEKRLARNMYTPIPWKNYSLEEISDYELEDKVWWFFELVEFLIQNDDQARNYILDWFAFNIQQPGEKVFSSVILSGVQGTGKSTLGVTIKRILDGNCQIRKASEIAEKWNTFFSTSSLIICEELRQSGEDGRRFQNEVKNLITGSEIRTEMKHRDPRDVDNHVNFMFLTNYVDSIAIDDTENRYYFYHSEAIPRASDDDYFTRYYENLERDIDYLYTWFMRRDLSNFDPKARAPHNHHKDVMLREIAEDWKSMLDRMLDNEEISLTEPVYCVDLISRIKDKHPRIVVTTAQIKKFLCYNRGFVEIEHDGYSAAVIHETTARKINQAPLDDAQTFEIIMNRVGEETWVSTKDLSTIRKDVNPGFNVQVMTRFLEMFGWKPEPRNGVRGYRKIK